MQLEDSDKNAGWAALAPLMAEYHRKIAEAREADTKALSQSVTEAKESANAGQMSEGERDLINRLKARDQEVRTHEAAHMSVGGQHAGGASYTYQIGPDGKRYAIGGEVPIDVSPVAGDPEATIEKMEQIKAAVLAPAEPSSADSQIAAAADAARAKAQADLNALKAEQRSGTVDQTA